MLISHSKKFIFIHNCKVAGTSIRKALGKYAYNPFLPLKLYSIYLKIRNSPAIYSKNFDSHVTAVELKKALPSDTFNAYFKFGFVRNPWDWQVSLYTYSKKNPNHPHHKLMNSFKGFDEYLDWCVNNDLHLQKSFFYDENEQCLVDFIGRYETINQDFEQVCSHLNLETKLGITNVSREEGKSYLHYYNTNTIDIVFQAFQEDIMLFNYSKPII